MGAKIKHLEFIQNVINRMTSNSFLLKGWCLTIVGGVFALKGNSVPCLYTGALLLFVIMFWLLDSYYLFQERLFVALYNHTTTKSESEINFSMRTKDFCKGRDTWLRSFFSITLVVFYGALFIGIIIINFLI